MVKTRVVQLDFSQKYDAATFTKIYNENLKDIDVSVLVNNVGMSGAIFEPFWLQSEQEVHNVMSCNMYANVLLTRELIEHFKRRSEKKERSCIIFTSAMASLAPVPGIGSYSASKIFCDYLTWGLGYELKKYRVDVSAWRAAGVATNIIGAKGKAGSVMLATPDQYVQQAMGKVTSSVHSGYLPHEILHLIWTNLHDVVPIYFC